QKARGELSARAAETPVLAEVKALQRNVKLLLAEIESTADQNASRLEQRCAEARDLMQALEHQREVAEEILQQALRLSRESALSGHGDSSGRAALPETDAAKPLRPAAARVGRGKRAAPPAGESDSDFERE